MELWAALSNEGVGCLQEDVIGLQAGRELKPCMLRTGRSVAGVATGGLAGRSSPDNGGAHLDEGGGLCVWKVSGRHLNFWVL